MSLAAIYVTLLRIIHITAAVTWIGGGIFMVSVLAPTVAEAGPDGGRFMLRLASIGRATRVQTAAAILTVLAGLLLYWPTSGGLNSAWLKSANGITLTIGAIFGILAFFHGAFATGGALRKLGVVAKDILNHQGPPPPELMAQAQAMGAKIGSLSATSMLLGALALLFMAAAQTI